eukprot:gene8438-11415_t
MSKRKQDVVGNISINSQVDLVEKIKRCRITNTPGELRLQKDVQELNEDGVNIKFSVNPASIIITFDKSGEEDDFYLPSSFSVEVPKYYPHSAPQIKCLDNQIYQTSSYINVNGDVIHIGLNQNWNALCSLRNVVEILKHIRASFLESTIPQLPQPIPMQTNVLYDDSFNSMVIDEG